MMMKFKDCNVIVWNVRGAVNKKGQRHVKELVRKFSPIVFVLLETHTAFKRVKRFWSGLGFIDMGIVEANGHSGGIWVLAMENSDFSFGIVDYFEQMISIKMGCGSSGWLCRAIYASPIPSIRKHL